MLKVQVDQGALGGLLALVALVYLQNHTHPAEQHKDLSYRFATILALCGVLDDLRSRWSRCTLITLEKEPTHYF